MLIYMDIVDGKFVIIEGDVILVVIGCKLMIEGLNFQVVGVEVDSYGVIVVNGYLYIIVLNIWVMGDVKGGLQFIYILLDDYWIIWDDFFGNKECMVDDCNLVVYLVFIDLFFLYVGLIEEEVIKWGYFFKVLCFLVFVLLCVCML